MAIFITGCEQIMLQLRSCVALLSTLTLLCLLGAKEVKGASIADIIRHSICTSRDDSRHCKELYLDV